ncbi:cytochrome c oxidase assembly protein [Solimonas marina]|uniref:Cytochrome c oxidase assembly protein CtaG n=1 Tax=Solimonas marina TaxID=2714601 RepID=A0A970B8E8_9GAMM|nr:cytochrome c oxidase assembly protein [Solimonas marina]NKF22209.1 cytochrome c oxidase assembly protein [Solimonas marina]
MTTAARHNTYRHGLRLLFVTALMFAFGFAMVPLYDKLCYALGLNGRVANEAATVGGHAVDVAREVTVEFLTTVNGGRPWHFAPDQASVTMHPGEMKTVSFVFRNTQDRDIVAQAVPNIAPATAARYLHKTECFCFNQQAFAAGEEKHMPVAFTLDPSLPDDIERLTLAYTFFDVTDSAPRLD